MPHKIINDLVYEGCGKVVFGTIFIQITTFFEDMNGALFLKNRNSIGHPCCVFNGINETIFLELIYFSFDSFLFGRMDRPFILAHRDGIGPSFDVMFNNDGIKYGNFRIRPRENITEFFE